MIKRGPGWLFGSASRPHTSRAGRPPGTSTPTPTPAQPPCPAHPASTAPACRNKAFRESTSRYTPRRPPSASPWKRVAERPRPLDDLRNGEDPRELAGSILPAPGTVPRSLYCKFQKDTEDISLQVHPRTGVPDMIPRPCSFFIVTSWTSGGNLPSK